MRGWEQQVQGILREFESYFSNRLPKPLEIKQVWDSMWEPEDEAILSPIDWKKLTGVYLFSDVCKADGSLSDSPDHYSVIHRLGIATDRSFGKRLADYGYPDKRPLAYYYHKKKKEWVQWFRYRWIDIIPINKIQTPSFLPVALENFLLEKIHPTENTYGVPYALRGQQLIFADEGLECDSK